MPMRFRPLLSIGTLGMVLFGSAGRMDLPFFWAYLGVWTALLVGFLLVADPGLRQERLRVRGGKRAWLLRLVLLPFGLAHWVVAGLDVGRFHWSGIVPLGVQAACLAGFALSLGVVLWSMAANRFFAPAVRIQQERGHHVVTSGPYRYVRHPGYAGMLLAFIFSGPALGSWRSMLPVAGYVLVILRRTVVEDRFLRGSLDGYADYAGRVRYRLLPGLW